MKLILLPLAALLSSGSTWLHAQPTVMLRASGPAGFSVSGATNTSPVVIQTRAAHGLAVGDTISLYGMCAVNSATNNFSAANGVRKVKGVLDATHFSITDTSGVDVSGNGVWCDGSLGGWPGGAQAGGKVLPFFLTLSPRGMFDGPNGIYLRKLSLGTANGLVSLTVSGGIATVTTSYNHGVSINDNIGVWNTANSSLNGDRVVTSVTSTTFQFAAPSVPEGDYTQNNTCGPDGFGNIGGTQNCVRISQLAYSTAPQWSRMLGDLSSYLAPAAYKHPYDGGTFAGTSMSEERYAEAGVKFLVDQKDAQSLAIAKYGITRVERVDGVNWLADENQSEGGTTEMSDFGSYVFHGLATSYLAVRDYLTAGDKQTFFDKVYNDLDSGCNKVLPVRKILAAGTAQAGSTTSITLPAADAAADGYYINNVIRAVVGGANSDGLVTAYNPTTKVATVSSWSKGAPTSGTAYTIYATISRSGTTITGYNTTFTSDVSVGDSVTGWNTPYLFHTAYAESYITAVNSDTSLTVINGQNVMAAATPSIVYITHAWKAGDCGLLWLQKHWSGYPGAQPSQYPGNGGSQSSGFYGPVLGSNNQYTWAAGHIALGLAAADDDPRAARDLTIAESQAFDYLWPFALNSWTGFTQSGTGYSFGRTAVDGAETAWLVQNGVSGYPSLDTSGPWIMGLQMAKMYTVLPDHRTGAWWAESWGGQNAYYFNLTAGQYGGRGASIALDHGLAFNPNASSSRFLQSFLSAKGLAGSPAMTAEKVAQAVIKLDPRQASSDYTAQPTQYLFSATSQPTCALLTGWPCPATFTQGAFVSRSGWSSLNDTHVLFQARSFWSDHDHQNTGVLRVYKVGFLLANDEAPPSWTSESDNQTVLDSLPEFGGTNTLHSGQGGDGIAANSPIVRWASATHGSWDPPYGDANSRFAYAMADLSGAYTTPLTRATREILHFKKPGTEEILIQRDDLRSASTLPGGIRTQVHYSQNGEQTGGSGQVEYNEGQTTCPVSTCANLNTDRVILSQEDGGSDGTNTRNYGVITRFLSPGTVFVRDDGSSFGGNGHSHRVSICAGSSCGSAASTLEAIIVHKITATVTGDTTLTATSLNVTGWAGVQTTDKVAMFARAGATPSSLSFNTTHASKAQYLIAGLAPGRYNVSVSGLRVLTGAIVGSGDNTLYFESNAGAVSIIQSGLIACAIGTTSFPFGIAGAPYTQTPQTTEDCTPPVAWSVSAGTLCPGMAIDPSTGTISGTPSATQTCAFTLQAKDSTPSTATQDLTITIAPPSAGTAISGGISCSGCLWR